METATGPTRPSGDEERTTIPDEQPPTFAVVLKTHIWDEFVERQLERLRAYAGSGTVIVLADETAGPLSGITHDRVVRVTNDKLVGMGLADASPRGNLIWWNTDYPNYYLRQEAEAFEYYVFVEYDAAVLTPLDRMLTEVAARELDFVTLPTREDRERWHWTRLHERVYPGDALHRSLNCISVFSARAVDLLLARRREATVDLHDGRQTFWPMNEVFVPSEMARAGWRTASLAEFGDVGRYEWHPPTLEADLVDDGKSFVHPVLDQERYIKSVLRYEFDLSQYATPRSRLWTDFSRFPRRSYLPQIPGAFYRSVLAKVNNALGRS